jgi:hypothetical protein
LPRCNETTRKVYIRCITLSRINRFKTGNTTDHPDFDMLNFDAIALVLSCIGTLCWIVCFWWMHRISSRQNATLEELHQMTVRIEKLSRSEHDLIREVHPQVNEIKEKVENVREAVSSDKS